MMETESSHASHSNWVDALSRAISRKDFQSILTITESLLNNFPQDTGLIVNRQAALIALGKANLLSKEFDAIGDEIFENDDLAINYFDFLYHEEKFEELFHFIFLCASQERLDQAKEYIVSATEKFQHIRSSEFLEAEASLTYQGELPLYDRIMLSFSQPHERPCLPDATRRVPILYLQVDVLLRQIANGHHATGIQRAICEIINAIPCSNAVRVFFFRPEMSYPVSISSLEFLDILKSDVGRHKAWRLLFGPVSHFGVEEANGFLPSSIDKVVLLDCFWACPAGRLAAFLDECKCESFLMIYDLIPLTVPGEPADGRAFEASLGVLEKRVDGFLAISNFTKSVVDRYLYEKGIRKACISVPLAQQKPSEFGVFLGNSRTSLADRFLIEDLLDKPFVLTVSSVSGRKRILETAEAFLDTFDACREWFLVIVGHDPGHDRKLTEALLEACRESAGRIVWLKDVGDRDLDRLYQNCGFVTYLSRNEGWGLPIGEALAHGKLPLAHQDSSIPEVGGDLAVYCEADRKSVSMKLAQIMQDKSLRKRVEGSDVRSGLRTWRDVASDFLCSVDFNVRQR